MSGNAATPVAESDLPGADWVDRQGVSVKRDGVTAADAARLALGDAMPGWVAALMRLRNFMVGFVGLKGAGPGAGEDGGRSIGGFPIVSETPEKLVLGFNDWHLDFRIVVEAVPQAAGNVDFTDDARQAQALVWKALYLSHHAVSRADRKAEPEGDHGGLQLTATVTGVTVKPFC